MILCRASRLGLDRADLRRQRWPLAACALSVAHSLARRGRSRAIHSGGFAEHDFDLRLVHRNHLSSQHVHCHGHGRRTVNRYRLCVRLRPPQRRATEALAKNRYESFRAVRYSRPIPEASGRTQRTRAGNTACKCLSCSSSPGDTGWGGVSRATRGGNTACKWLSSNTSPANTACNRPSCATTGTDTPCCRLSCSSSNQRPPSRPACI